MMRFPSLIRRHAALVGTLLAAVVVAVAGALRIDLAENGLASPTNVWQWGTPWDTAAQSPDLPIVESLSGMGEALAWLMALGIALLLTSTLLHTGALALRQWKPWTVRRALGAHRSDLRRLVSLRQRGAAWLVVTLAVVGVSVAAWLESSWPGLVVHPKHLGGVALAAAGVAVAILMIRAYVLRTSQARLLARVDLTGELRGDTVTDSKERVRGDALIAVAQFALLITITVTAVSVWNDSLPAAHDPEARGVLLMQTSTDIEDRDDRAAGFRDAWLEIREAGHDVAISSRNAWLGYGPGVTIATTCSDCFRGQFFTPLASVDARVIALSPESLAIMGAEFATGRDFRESDFVDSEPVVILNSAAASALFPSSNALNRIVHLGGDILDAGQRVIGVADREPAGSLASGPEVPIAYVSLFQFPPTELELGVPGSGEAPLPVEPQLAAAGLDVGVRMPLADQVDRYRQPLEYQMSLFALIAACCVVSALAALGSVMLRTVRSRSREIAIRVALGARRRHVLWWVLRRTATIVGCGVVVGLSGARFMWDVVDAGRSAEGIFYPVLFTVALFAALALTVAVAGTREALAVAPAQGIRANTRS